MTSIDMPTEFPGLKGKNIILTGGSSGIGLATAQFLTSQGANLLVADLSPPPPSLPPSQTHYHGTDVTSWPSLLSLFTAATSLFPHLDVVIANAGIGEIEDMFLDATDYETGLLLEPRYKVLDVNLKGVMNTVKLAVHAFRTAGRGGSVILTASTAGYLSEKCIPVYTAAKHGVVGFMRSTSATAGKYGISVNCVAPWFTESGLITEEMKDILNDSGVEVQKAESVARAMAYVAVGGAPAVEKVGKGKQEETLAEEVLEGKELWTGHTVYVSCNTFTEIEGPLRQLEPQWLGEVNAETFRRVHLKGYFVSGSGM